MIGTGSRTRDPLGTGSRLTLGARAPRIRHIVVTVALVMGGCAWSTAAQASPHVIDTLAITTASLPNGTVGISYGASLSASGGTAPYTWSILTGAVPLGIVLNSSGTVAGIPAVAGVQEIELRATDATGFQVTATVALDIAPPPVPPQQVEAVSAAGRVTMTGNLAALPVTEQVGATDVVGVATSPTGAGAWIVTRSGQVFATGSLPVYGDLPVRLSRAGVAGIAANAEGTGYWIATRRGRVFGFGAAKSLGSLRRGPRSSLVVAIARSNGDGYYLLQRSGRVTGFGTDVLDGFLHVHRQRVQVTGIAATPGGRGYWVVASSGEVFSFGTARADHPLGPTPSGRIVGIAAAPAGIGYYLVTEGGLILSYGSALTLPPVTVVPSDPVVGVGASG